MAIVGSGHAGASVERRPSPSRRTLWGRRFAALGIAALAAVAAYPAADAADAADEAAVDALLWLLQRPRALPPEAPGRPSVMPASSSSLTVTWAPPRDAADVVDYDVQYRAAGAEPFLDWPHDGTETGATVTGLAAGTAYEIRIRAGADAGAGDWSEPGTGTTHPPRPEFAEGERAHREVDENSAPGMAVGAPLTAVRAVRYTLDGDDAGAFAVDAPSGQLRTREGVAYDHERRAEYAVTVRAHAAAGEGAGIAVTIAVRDVDEPPSAPPAPDVAASSSTRLTVTWEAPENTGPPVTDYDVQYRAFGGDFVDAAHDGAATSARVTGLRRGTRYEVRVRATNAEGTGPWSERGSGSTAGRGGGSGGGGSGTGGGDSGTGTGGSGTGTGGSGTGTGGSGTGTGGSGTGTGDSGTGTGGSGTGTGGSGTGTGDSGTGTGGTGTGTGDSGTGTGDSGTGTGGSGSGGEPPVPDEPPGRPDAPTLTVYARALTATWTAPANAGPPIVRYGFRYGRPRRRGEPVWTAVPDVIAPIVVIGNLTSFTLYEVQVRAINAAGAGPWSESSRARTTLGADEGGIRLVGDAPTRGRLEVFAGGDWQLVCDDGFDATAMDVACRQLGFPDRSPQRLACPRYRDFAMGSGTDADYVLDDMVCDGSEERLVDCPAPETVHNCTYWECATVSCRHPAEPDAPTVTVTSATAAEVTWAAPRGVAPGAVEDYDYRYRQRLHRKPFETTAWTTVDDTDLTGTRVSVEGLASFTYYDVQVRATVAGEVSSWSEAAGARTLLGPGDGALRLAGGTSTRGRLEVMAGGAWGTVCDDAFHPQEARVACRQLEFPTANTAFFGENESTDYGDASGLPIHLDQLDCDGTEQRLIDCPTVPLHNCVHAEDIELDCDAP